MPVRADLRARLPAAARVAAGLACAAALLLPGCASTAADAADPASGAEADDKPLALVSLAPGIRVELATPRPGDATSLLVTVTLTAPADAGAQPLTVVGVRQDATTEEERSLLELSVHFTDYRSDLPRCTGKRLTLLLPFVDSGTAQPGAPLQVTRTVDLPPTQGLVARTVEVSGRIIGVDLQLPAGHSGGTILTLPEARLDCVPPPPPGTLAEHLQSHSVPGIFLSAAAAPADQREETIGTLIGALPATPEPERGAIFAALLFLTGETHGRDMYRWSSWWKARKAASVRG